MRRATPLVLVAVIALTAACNGDGAVTSDGSEQAEERRVRVFDVAGVEVVVETEAGRLVDRAATVEFTGWVIDSGSGPEWCLSGVAESLPPSCDGPVVEGLAMDPWADELNGVRWGVRTVTVSWPPVDGRIQAVADGPAERREFTYPPGDLPDECAGIDEYVASGAINDYARSLGVRSGGVYVSNDGVVVLQVTDDPAVHREALASGPKQACVVQSQWSEIELQALKARLEPRLERVLDHVAATASGTVGRVDVYVPVADRDTVLAVAAMVDQPSAVRVIGGATLVGPVGTP